MFTQIIIAAVVGAIGGAVGGLLGAVLSRRTAKEGSKPSVVPLVLGLVLGLAAAELTLRVPVTRMLVPPREPTPLEQLGKAMLAIPGVQERVRGKSPREVQVITQRLSASGLVKLSDAQLVERAQLVSRMVGSLSEESCARFALNSMNGDDFVQMVASLPEGERTRWFAIVHASVEAAVSTSDASAAPTLTTMEVATALVEAAKALPEAERSRFQENLNQLTTISHSEACWTIRQLYAAISNASGEDADDVGESGVDAVRPHAHRCVQLCSIIM